MSIQQSDVLYTAVATPLNGRDGRVATDDGRLDDGFGLIVEISACIPEVDPDTARSLIERAHEVCPYSKVTRDNIGVTLA